MRDRVSLTCRCGTVRGVATGVSPRSGCRVVCYCDDCQAYARWLDATELVDDHGGLEVFQLAPAQLAVTGGMHAVRCMRLSDRGLYRWYAGCCRTSVGNAISARVPFIGLSVRFMALADDAEREAVLGRRSSIQGRFARGGVPAHAPARASVALVAKSARLVLGWWLTGRGSPSPLFDGDRLPRQTPEVLVPEARAALDQA